jgi:hypothetical protein
LVEFTQPTATFSRLNIVASEHQLYTLDESHFSATLVPDVQKFKLVEYFSAE